LKSIIVSKTSYHQKIDEIFSKQNQKSYKIQSSLDFATWIDQILTNHFNEYLSSSSEPIALFALGSYGRLELNPYSDIDLLLVHKAESTTIETEIKLFIQSLWDIGLEVGHQFVTPDQCFELALEDVAIRTTLLEMRFICGDQNFSNDLERSLNKKVFNIGLRKFAEQLLNDTNNRHQKYGLSPQLLEPHIKEGVGGLRDLHILLWLFRVNRDWQKKYFIKNDNYSSIFNFLDSLRNHSLILGNHAEKLELAFQFLFKVRTQIHLLSGRKSDFLEYGIQKKIAESLDYRNREQWLAVEHFMRDYYTHSRRIFHTYLILSEKLARRRKSIVADKKNEAEKITNAFYIFNGEIHLHPSFQNIFEENPSELMQIFIYRRQYGVRLSESLREKIYYVVGNLGENFRTDKTVVQLFIKLVKNPKHLAENLRTMHELRLLDLFLPEFSALTSLAQHDLYHYYSADEHTLFAIDNLIKLDEITDPENHLAQVYKKIQDKSTLILATLFHDLGKAKKGDHTIVGVDIANDILNRWEIEGEQKSRILFLIRNHQKMEQVSFRRNVEDFSTVREFVQLVGDEENLKLLYLLSYADLSAVNPNIWTDWKGILLKELFIASQNYLRGEKREIKIDFAALENLAKLVQDQLPSEFDQRAIINHLNKIPNHYLDNFDERQIATHIELINLLSGKSNILHFEDYNSHIVITTITQDQPFCLANICGVLSVHDMNIFSAQIFTRSDDIVVDVFRVIPVSPNIRFDDIEQNHISSDLDEVLTGSLDLRNLFVSHKRKWKRRKFRKTVYPDEINFDNRAFSPFTIIDIFTDDSVGLLYRLALAMSELKLNILAAKISTRLEQVADSFYVVDEQNKKIKKSKQQDKVRQYLLKAIHREF